MTKRTHVNLSISQSFPLIRCVCGHVFLLFAVCEPDEPDDDNIQIFDQCTTYFCPYCGKKIMEEKKKP